jgi:hypothetical protein
MTDFRVPLPSLRDEAITRELDWDREVNLWTLSEREYGDSAWVQNLKPSEADVDHLLEFFRLVQQLSPESLIRLSPGEMAHLHRSSHRSPTVVATLCEECGNHWIVYRLEENQWRRYGRSCDFMWFRGSVADPRSDDALSRLLEAAS